MLVTIAQFKRSADAAVAKHAMDSAGIESAVENVRLSVQNSDAYRAYDALDPAIPVVEEAYEEGPSENCRSCGSFNVYVPPRFRTFAGLAALITVVGIAAGITDGAFFAVGAAALFLLMSDRRRCADCGESWN